MPPEVVIANKYFLHDCAVVDTKYIHTSTDPKTARNSEKHYHKTTATHTHTHTHTHAHTLRHTMHSNVRLSQKYSRPLPSSKARKHIQPLNYLCTECLQKVNMVKFSTTSQLVTCFLATTELASTAPK